MTRHNIFITSAAAASLALLAGSPALASSTVDMSTLISNADATTIAGYLGQGDLSLHNIFTKVKGDGKTSFDFHAAADGKGPTFNIYSASYLLGGDRHTDIIGGYDPQSWDLSGWHFAPTNAERTAFIFNVSSGTQLPENQDASGINFGFFQTYNGPDFGPSFGGKHDDITAYSSLEGGIADAFAYTLTGESILGHGLNNTDVTFNAIETFTFSPRGGTVTPEPSQTASFGLGALALAGLAAFARKRQNVNAIA